MKYTISLFTIVVIIFIIHTILTHLLNWLFRDSDNDDASVVGLILMIVELAATYTLLHYYLT